MASEVPVTHNDEARALVADRLRMLGSEHGDTTAAIYEGRDFTWRDFAILAERIGSILGSAGTAPDLPIAVVVRSRPWCLASVFAVLAQGRCAVLVTPVQADATLAEEIERMRPAVLVADPEDWQRPGVSDAAAAAGVLGIRVTDDLEPLLNDPDSVGTTDDRLTFGRSAAITVLTSGTTGPPKRLPVSWDTFVSLGGGRRPREPESGRGAMILSLPLATLGGLMAIARTVFAGRPLAMMDRFDVTEWASLVRRYKPRVMGAPPPVVPMILDADIPPDWFAGVSAFATSSAPVAPEVAAAFEERYGIPVLLGYGATEFLGAVTGWTAELYEESGAEKLGSVGRPLRGVSLRIVDDATGEEVPPGDPGLVEVDPPLRSTAADPGWMQTSDRGRVDEDGFLWILGRADDIIIRGGFKVDLGEVESALEAHPAVVEASVVGLDDDRLGQVPGAAVTCGQPQPGADEILEWVRGRLPPYAVPTVLTVIDEIPRTSTLKKNTGEVRRRLSGESGSA